MSPKTEKLVRELISNRHPVTNETVENIEGKHAKQYFFRKSRGRSEGQTIR